MPTLRESAQVKQALSDAEQKQGCCVDVLVANAGVGPCGAPGVLGKAMSTSRNPPSC